MAKRRRFVDTASYEDANESQKMECPLPLHSFRKRRWTGKKPRTFIASWIRHRCNNEMHVVAIASGGQLIFQNHTIAELKRELVLNKMGGSCKCAQLYWDWRIGNVSSGVIQQFQLERSCWYETRSSTEHQSGVNILSRTAGQYVTAYRMMLKRRRRRRSIEAYQGVTIPEPSYEGYRSGLKGYGGKMLVEIKGQILAKMRLWGWRVSEVEGIQPRSNDEKYEGVAHPFSFDTINSSPPRTTLHFETGGGHSMLLSTVTRWNFDTRLACDLCEVSVINQLLRRGYLRNKNNRENDIEKAAERRAQLLAKHNLQIKIHELDKLSVSYSLTMCVRDLSLQGVELLAKEFIDKFGVKAKAVVQSSRKRLQAPVKLPMPSSSGMFKQGIPVDRLQQKLQK